MTRRRSRDIVGQHTAVPTVVSLAIRQYHDVISCITPLHPQFKSNISRKRPYLTVDPSAGCQLVHTRDAHLEINSQHLPNITDGTTWMHHTGKGPLLIPKTCPCWSPLHLSGPMVLHHVLALQHLTVSGPAPHSWCHRSRSSGLLRLAAPCCLCQADLSASC